MPFQAAQPAPTSQAERYLAEVHKDLVARDGFRGFVKACWYRIDPARLTWTWHMAEIARHLEAVYRGEIKNLIINVPPGTGKSSLVNVLWPLWCWLQDPALKWIFASNDPGLAHRDARRVRELIASPWWRDRWPHVALDPRGSEAVGEYQTSEMGARLSVGVGQRILGWHGDIKVIDDPNKPQGVAVGEVSKVDLERVIEWYSGTLGGRNVDVKKTRTVLVMQRLHQLDLTGYLLDEMRRGVGERFEHLCLPMEYEPARRCATSVGGDRRTRAGELLCPERLDAEAVAILKQKLSTQRNIDAQLQQRPRAREGELIKAKWIRHWGPCSYGCQERGCQGPVWPECAPIDEMRLEASWDATFTGAETSDYVVGQIWGHMKSGFAVLLAQARGQWSFVETLTEFENFSAAWPRAFRKKMEKAANADAINSVFENRIPGIELIPPDGDKADRLETVSPLFQAGYVIYPSPQLYPWVETVNIHEILSFPTAANDDTVDATTQELKELAKGNRAAQLKAANLGARAWLQSMQKAQR